MLFQRLSVFFVSSLVFRAYLIIGCTVALYIFYLCIDNFILFNFISGLIFALTWDHKPTPCSGGYWRASSEDTIGLNIYATRDTKIPSICSTSLLNDYWSQFHLSADRTGRLSRQFKEDKWSTHRVNRPLLTS